jgi:Penicillin-insensitive murein endopeptidase
MRCHVGGAEGGDMIGRIIGLVFACRDTVAGGFGDGFEHALRGAPFGRAIGLGHLGCDRAAGRCFPSTPAIKSASTSIFGLRRCQATRKAREEREFAPGTDLVAPDLRDVDPKVWTQRHTALIRTAAQDPVVVRILVNAAIKKALCREAGADHGADHTWLLQGASLVWKSALNS